MTPLIIPIAIEWVILVTNLAPIVLVGRFSNRPRLGLVLWFSTFLSSGLATLLALGIAVASIYDTYQGLTSVRFGSSSWLATLALSFAPWLILAISGIALALANQRIEPIFASARTARPLLDAALQPLMKFQGHEVARIDLTIMVAAVARGRILVSSTALASLNEAELEAVLWHEIGHLRGRHNELKQLAGFIHALSPWITASKAMVAEVARIAECEADRFAIRHVDAEFLRATRSKFISS
ncbi:MAG: M48 family metalloprotease [Rhodoluna sp.]